MSAEDFQAWLDSDAPPDDVTCDKCGHLGPHIARSAEEPHWGRLDCGACGEYIKWIAAPKTKRTDRNAEWKIAWTERHGGDLLCHWCFVRKSQTRAAFEIDHIHPLEDDGPDEMRNTRPLCSDCHKNRHAFLNHQRHLRGLSARRSAA